MCMDAHIIKNKRVFKATTIQIVKKEAKDTVDIQYETMIKHYKLDEKILLNRNKYICNTENIKLLYISLIITCPSRRK